MVVLAAGVLGSALAPTPARADAADDAAARLGLPKCKLKREPIRNRRMVRAMKQIAKAKGGAVIFRDDATLDALRIIATPAGHLVLVLPIAPLDADAKRRAKRYFEKRGITLGSIAIERGAAAGYRMDLGPDPALALDRVLEVFRDVYHLPRTFWADIETAATHRAAPPPPSRRTPAPRAPR